MACAGVVALVAAALVAFVPLMLQVWSSAARLSSVVAAQCGPSVVVRPGRHQREQEGDKPGEIALLQVVCDIPSSDGWRGLVADDDPAGPRDSLFESNYVRHERVYPAQGGNERLPFGLLGPPPVTPAPEPDPIAMFKAAVDAKQAAGVDRRQAVG